MGDMKQGTRTTNHRIRRALLAGVVAAVATGGLGSRASAQTIPFPSAGTCLFTGSATFSPNLTLAPAGNVEVVVRGSGSCEGAGIPLGETVTFAPYFLGSVPLASCALSEGSLAGTVNFGGSVPLSYVGGATYIGGPATSTVTIVSGQLIATATLVWTNPSAILSCPTSGTASTPLTGTFTFVAP